MGPGTGAAAPGCEARATATSAEPAASVLDLRIIVTSTEVINVDGDVEGRMNDCRVRHGKYDKVAGR